MVYPFLLELVLLGALWSPFLSSIILRTTQFMALLLVYSLPALTHVQQISRLRILAVLASWLFPTVIQLNNHTWQSCDPLHAVMLKHIHLAAHFNRLMMLFNIRIVMLLKWQYTCGESLMELHLKYSYLCIKSHLYISLVSDWWYSYLDAGNLITHSWCAVMCSDV